MIEGIDRFGKIFGIFQLTFKKNKPGVSRSDIAMRIDAYTAESS